MMILIGMVVMLMVPFRLWQSSSPSIVTKYGEWHGYGMLRPISWVVSTTWEQRW